MNEKFLKIITFSLLLAFYACFLVHKINLPAADDLPRQIKIGQELLHGNFQILYKNIFSYAEPDHPFYNHHWLSTIIFYLLHLAVGWSGLEIFKVAVLLAVFSLVFLTAAKKSNFWLAALVSIPAILILRNRSDLRPEIFSYLFIALYLYLFAELDENPQSKRIFWLIPLQLLWVNIHIFFSVGIMLVGGFLLEKIILNFKNLKANPLIKKLLLVFAAVALVSLINPRGFSGAIYRYPDKFPAQISENQSIPSLLREQPRWDDISVGLFEPLAALLLASFALGYKRKPVFYFLASVATIAITFYVYRSMAFFGMTFLPALCLNLDSVSKKIAGWLDKRILQIGIYLLVTVLAILVIIGSQGKFIKYKKPGLGLVQYSNNAAEFFKQENLKGPIFNDPDSGSYLIYHLYPKEKIFTDNRFGDAYSSELFQEYIGMMNDEKAWQAGIEKYNFNIIFFYAYDPGANLREFLYHRVHDPNWAFIYADKHHVILVRNTVDNQELIKKFLITKNNIADRVGYLLSSDDSEDRTDAADLFNLLDRQDLSMQVYLDVTNRWPDQSKVWLIMSEIELVKKDTESRALGLTYAQKAIDTGWRVPQTYFFLGLGYFYAGQTQKALEALDSALAIDPENQTVLNLRDYIKTH